MPLLVEIKSKRAVVVAFVDHRLLAWQATPIDIKDQNTAFACCFWNGWPVFDRDHKLATVWRKRDRGGIEERIRWIGLPGVNVTYRSRQGRKTARTIYAEARDVAVIAGVEDVDQVVVDS